MGGITINMEARTRKRMTNDVMKIKVATMENDIKEIKDEVKLLPDIVASKVEQTVELKIKLAISESEKRAQAKFITMLLAIIGEGISLVVAFIKIAMGH